MKRLFRDAGHLIRLAGLLFAAILAFLLVRQLVVPAGFGQYGHYRPQALAMNRERPVVHAGRQACLACHDGIEQSRQGGRHAQIGCEACHGPLAKHAEDPSQLTPTKPDGAKLCARCHEADAAKPRKFPQVVTREHMGGAGCTTCHKAHNPKL